MDPIQSKFSPYKFLGATAVSFESMAGYSDSASSARISLIEDLSNGDVFNSGIIGAPYRFQASGLSFDGILRNIETSKSIQGNPTYDVYLTSPVDILDGCKVILGAYNGQTNQLKNLLNVYGLYENTYGFGGAGSNDSGMAWEATHVNVSGIPWSGNYTVTSGTTYGVKVGIEYILNNDTGFGSGIFYKGFRYIPDFSGLPVPPSYYRVGNTSSASIMDLVSQVCQDAGAEYIISLRASVDASGYPIPSGINYIDIRTYLKSTVAPLGKIDEFIAAQPSGTVTSSQKGVEMRNMENAIFITGENLQNVFIQTNPNLIKPFWGFDILGNPIYGSVNINGVYNFNLNSYPIYDIIGSYFYNSTYEEMRFALSSYDMWAGYVEWWNPLLAKNLKLPSTFSLGESSINSIFNQPVFSHDFIGQNPEKAYNLGSVNTENGFVTRGQALYQFVRRYAEEFYGKKFLVATPTPVYSKIESETNRVVYSWEPCDGGYLPEGTGPLGLNYFNEDLFKNENGTLRAFVAIPGQGSGDYTSMTNGICLSQGPDLYIGAAVNTDYGVLYQGQFGLQPSMVVVELESPLFQKPKDAMGSVDAINQIFGIPGLIDYAVAYRQTDFGGQLHPAAYAPSGVAFPMRSTQFTYGPWISGGLDGKVEYRQKPDYAPWNYGGYTMMNAAATSEIQNFVSNAQQQETGTITVIGTPIKTLGDILLANGPVITDISAQFGIGGIQTTYTMRSYTPRFGYFSRDNIERLRRFGLNMSQLRRNLRQLYRGNR